MPDLKKMLTLEALSEALPSWLKRSTKPEYNADEIDSTLTTNQFVTVSDKDNWNAKGTYSKPSGGIPKSDLSSIVQASLEKADSALQSETDPTVPSWAKALSKPSYNSDEISDTNRIHKFATAAQLNQISTNQTNILYGLQTGVKNLFDLKNANLELVTNISTVKTDTSLTVTTTGEKKWSHVSIPMELEAGTYHVLATISNRTADASAITRLIVTSNAGGSSELGGVTFTNNGTIDFQFTTTGGTIYFIPYPNYSATGYNSTFTASEIMVCTKAAWDQEPNVYRPHALSNSDLTVLEAEDRDALAEVVDSGAKNEFDYHDRVVHTNLTSFVNNGDGSFTAKNDSQIIAVDISFITVVLKSGITYSLSGTPSGGSNDSYSMDIRTTTGGYAAGSDLGEGFEFSVPTTGEYRMCFRFGAGYTIPSAGITFKPMICTKAKSDVSPKFVAYNTMAQWTKVEKEYTSTAADTMEYCGVSFTVPANQIYEFIVMDRFNAGNPKGLGVADNSTNYNSNSTVIAENMADFSVSNVYPWVRQLTGMTVPYSQNTSYYVWVKRGSASKNTVYLMYRRIL